MGAKYTTQTISGYNSSPPPDDGSQTASNLITWAAQKTKLADPIKTLSEAVNTALVAAFNYSVRQVTASDSLVAGDHMRTVEVAPTVSSTVAVTLTLADAATMTSTYRVYIKNSRPDGVVTIARATGGDTIEGVAANITLPAMSGVVLSTTTGANGYIIEASYGLALNGFTITAGNLTFGAASAKIIPGATNFSLRNNADSADNLLISDAGLVTVRNGLTVTAGNAALTNGNVSFGTSGKGIVGTTTNDAAAGGNVGEFVDSSVTAVTVVTAGTSNVTSISLTAGDWDVSAAIESGSTGTNTFIRAGISQNSASFTGTTAGKDAIYGPCNTTATVGFVSIPKTRVSLAGTTTIYLVATAGVAQITNGVNGYMSARRVR